MKKFLKMHFAFYVYWCHGKRYTQYERKSVQSYIKSWSQCDLRVFFSEINESVIVLFVLVVRSQILKHRATDGIAPEKSFV